MILSGLRRFEVFVGAQTSISMLNLQSAGVSSLLGLLNRPETRLSRLAAIRYRRTVRQHSAKQRSSQSRNSRQQQEVHHQTPTTPPSLIYHRHNVPHGNHPQRPRDRADLEQVLLHPCVPPRRHSFRQQQNSACAREPDCRDQMLCFGRWAEPGGGDWQDHGSA